VHQRLCIGKVIKRDKIYLSIAHDGSKKVPPDPSKSVDADIHDHTMLLLQTILIVINDFIMFETNISLAYL